MLKQKYIIPHLLPYFQINNCLLYTMEDYKIKENKPKSYNGRHYR